MEKQVREFIHQYHMLEPGDRVIAAVSGGADSVCLLSVLCGIARELPVSLSALHVHHGLRGQEADRDEACVRRLCGELGVPLDVVHRDVGAYARAHGLSTEEAGRVLRYEALEEAAAQARTGAVKQASGETGPVERETGKTGAMEQASGETGLVERETQNLGPAGLRPARIALAHHRDDSAETILFNLLRGSGLKGLSGIRPVQGNRIRPLLCVGRDDIRAYLTGKGIPWCEDSTNQSDDYTRNRIRNQILPLLTEQVNARASENILRAGQMFAQADAYLERQAAAVWAQAGSLAPAAGQQEARVNLAVFRQQEDIIRTYLIRRMFDCVMPGRRDITAQHFAQMDRLAARPVGSRMDLPGGMQAVVEYEALCIGPQREQQTALRTPERLTMTTFFREKEVEIPKNQYTKWFDYDKIKGTLSVRSRQKGDYLILPGGGRKTVARYMIDEKIPREVREEIPVLAEGNHVLWVIGYRISEYYKITDDTKTILQVTRNGGKDYGR